MTCAFVPLMPKDEIPARRGFSPCGQARASVSSSTAPAVQSTWDDGASTCRVAGSTPCRMARTILMIPPTPAAACVWPRFDLSEPRYSGWSAGRSRP